MQRAGAIVCFCPALPWQELRSTSTGLGISKRNSTAILLVFGILFLNLMKADTIRDAARQTAQDVEERFQEGVEIVPGDASPTSNEIPPPAARNDSQGRAR